MDILFDQNVNSKYLSALEGIDGVSVRTVKDALDPEASDGNIASRARDNEWVIFTNDDDFFVHASDIGLLYYSQVEDPSPGDVAAAVRQISTVYEDPVDIVETVPGDWV